MPDQSSELEKHVRRLPPSRLRRVCDPKSLAFETTAELKPFEGLVGQARALEALDLGARIDKPGFNVFVLGERGTARHGTVRALIDQYAAKMPAPADWVYVANFSQADRPRAIALPPGRAEHFKTAMDHAVDELSSLFPAIFESEEYQTRRRTAIEDVNEAGKIQPPLVEIHHPADRQVDCGGAAKSGARSNLRSWAWSSLGMSVMTVL